MNFIESIKTCVFKKYTKTEGRASRSEFCYFVLFYIGVIAISITITPYIEETTQYEFSVKNDYGVYVFFFLAVFGLGLLIPFYNVHIRRFHDINQSGSNFMIPLGLLLISGSVFSRLSGSDAAEGLAWVVLIFYLIILLLCLKPGDNKNNKFGKNIYKKTSKKR